MIAKTKTKHNSSIEYNMLKWLTSISFMEFFGEISSRVIGQDEGLMLVLAEIRSYIEGLIYGPKMGTNRHNILLAAGSGAGKTETYRALRDYFTEAIPGFMVTIHDVSCLSAAGYKGQEISDILLPYYEARITDAYGICFLDEFDKKIVPTYSSYGQNTNAEVQGQLLTLLEGGDIYDKRGRKVNTSNMMFVGLGSFNHFRNKRERVKNTIGIVSGEEREEQKEKKDHFAPLTSEDMVRAGGSWELLGRFSSIVNYRKLDEEALKRIVGKSIQNEADIIGVDIDVDDDAVSELVDIASDSRFGCRFINTKLHGVFIEAYAKALCEMPKDSQVTIRIHNLGNVSYDFTAYSDEDKEKTSKLMEELKAQSEKPEEIIDEDGDTWIAEVIGPFD